MCNNCLLSDAHAVSTVCCCDVIKVLAYADTRVRAHSALAYTLWLAVHTRRGSLVRQFIADRCARGFRRVLL